MTPTLHDVLLCVLDRRYKGARGSELEVWCGRGAAAAVRHLEQLGLVTVEEGENPLVRAVDIHMYFYPKPLLEPVAEQHGGGEEDHTEPSHGDAGRGRLRAPKGRKAKADEGEDEQDGGDNRRNGHGGTSEGLEAAL